MEAGTEANSKVRFKSFELNLKTGELWQGGVKIRLYGHPIEVLRLLIEHAGDVVTRETIQKTLWPEDVFVDFEHSLNSAINRLRDALGDSAEAPQLIETVPRVGYRFIAPLETVNGNVNFASETPSAFLYSARDPAAERRVIHDPAVPRSAVVQLGRSMIATERFVFRFSDVEVHENKLRATRAGQALEIEPKAFRVLVYLIKHAGRLVSRSELIETVWGETAATEYSLQRAIELLCRVLEDDPNHPKFIETISTRGYRFICPVAQEPDETSSPGDIGLAFSTDNSGQAAMSTSVAGTSESRRPHRRFLSWTITGIIVALGATCAAWWQPWFAPSVPHVTSIDRITNDGIPKNWPVTDGGRIYYTESINSHSVLAQVSTAGGEASTIPGLSVEEGGITDLAPDHASLLVTGGGPLWILPLPGGPPRKVGDAVADDANFVPDGKQILFTRSGELWIANVDGSQMRKIWKSPGILAFTPRVSPDGKYIRLSVAGPSGYFLWEVGLDGTGAHQVLPGWQDVPAQDAAAWSPDGRYYLFGAVTEKGAFHENIWMLPERRGWFSRRHPAPVQLTRGPLCFFPSIAFSPDGRTLFAIGKKDDSELVRYDPKTNRVAPFLSGIPATGVDFSRDGQWVVYTTTPYPTLWRSRRDGSERVQLTSSTDLQAGGAHWSPDGSRIAFERRALGNVLYPGNAKLALISRDGGTPEQVVPDTEDSHEQSDPTWSPDGNEMIYARDWLRRNEERMELLRVDLRTKKVTPVPGSDGLFSPRWSRDGHYLAAITVDMRTIRLFDFRKQVWTTWFTAEQEVGSNQWSTDGKALYFLNKKTKDSPLAWWRIGLGERTPTKIIEFPNERALGWWRGLEPDGSSAYFTRDLTSTEIYAIRLSYD